MAVEHEDVAVGVESGIGKGFRHAQGFMMWATTVVRPQIERDLPAEIDPPGSAPDQPPQHGDNATLAHE